MVNPCHKITKHYKINLSEVGDASAQMEAKLYAGEYANEVNEDPLL